MPSGGALRPVGPPILARGERVPGNAPGSGGPVADKPFTGLGVDDFLPGHNVSGYKSTRFPVDDLSGLENHEMFVCPFYGPGVMTPNKPLA